MNDLEYLRVKKLFTFRDYLHMFRQMFPQCLAWNWRVVWEDILQPAGIASREQFGYPIIVNDQFISPVGIVSREAFGSIRAGLNISPSGIASSESFGSLTVTAGFYLYDDFEDGTIKSGWNSAFNSNPSNWTVRTQQGQKIAYSPNANVCQLFPQSTSKISGNFEVKWQLVLGTGSGNTSIHLDIYDTSNVKQFGLEYVPSVIRTTETGTPAAEKTGVTAPTIITCKIVRTGGTIYAWYNNDVAGGEAGSWVREDAWNTAGNGFSFSGNCYLKVDGDDGWGGYGFIEVKGDALV